MSLDALRGFDMLWISGGHIVIGALAGLSGWSLFEWMEKQMDHVAWNGFHFYDVIFPLFLFIAGVTWPFSLKSRRTKGQSEGKIYGHVLKRVLLLVFFGMLYNGFLRLDFENMRYASVLARIGIAWGLGALIVMNSNPKWWFAWFGGILLSYWAIMALIPVPGFGAGDYSLEGNLVGYIDRILLPGKLYLGVFDPEGILSTFPAVASALLGSITGNFLLKPDIGFPRIKKFYYILAAGILAIVIGWFWNFIFPVNKNLWTSSFVLCAGGLSLVLLAIFYLIIDVWGYKRWAFFFVVIGLNSITIYLLQGGMIDFWSSMEYFFGGMANKAGGEWGNLIRALGYLSIVWLFLYVLYRKKIFLKV